MIPIRCTLLSLCLALACTRTESDPARTPQPAAGAPAEHAEGRSLGALTLAGHTFEVILFGDVTAGGEVPIDLEWPTGARRAEVVRAWIGTESGVGSRKQRLQKEGDRVMHEHLEVPRSIPEGSKLWIEIEEAGGVQRAAVAWH